MKNTTFGGRGTHTSVQKERGSIGNIRIRKFRRIGSILISKDRKQGLKKQTRERMTKQESRGGDKKVGQFDGQQKVKSEKTRAVGKPG